MVSQGMEELVIKLSTDWLFVERFLNDSKKALEEFDLEETEKECLLSRNVEQLMGLGYSQEEAEIVLSGAHTQTCPDFTTMRVLADEVHQQCRKEDYQDLEEAVGFMS